jgi:hypothetical protein
MGKLANSNVLTPLRAPRFRIRITDLDLDFELE